MREHRATDATSVLFPERMRVRTPKGLPAAIEAAARQHHTAPAEYVRQSLLRAIAADGIHLTPDGDVQREEGRRGT